jgi:acetylornithine deacetylase
MDDVCRRVLDEVDTHADAMFGILRQLVEIPSISGTDAENEAIAVTARIFADHGLEVDHWPIPLDEITARPDFPGVEVDRKEAWGCVGRLTGRRSGTGDAPALMFNGHVDVVPPGDLEQWTTDPFEARVDGGRLYGRGACDMKAGLVAALWATDAIRRSGVQLRGDVVVAAVLGEEDGGLGTYSTLARGWTADACVIPEPTGLDLVPANAGALTFRVVVPGKAAHASRRTEGVSSIEKFWPVFDALGRLEERRNRDSHPMAARWDIAYPLSIGTVRAGDWASSVPDVLVAEGRIGVAIDEPIEHTRHDLELAVREACDADPWLRDHPAIVEWWGGQFASGRLAADSDLLDRVRRAHAAVGGSEQDEWLAPFGSDLRLMTGIGGVPTLQYGPGDVALAHAADESVALDEIRTAARALAVLAVETCGHG